MKVSTRLSRCDMKITTDFYFDRWYWVMKGELQHKSATGIRRNDTYSSKNYTLSNDDCESLITVNYYGDGIVRVFVQVGSWTLEYQIQ